MYCHPLTALQSETFWNSAAAEFQKVSDCSAVRGWQYIYRFQPAESAVWPVNYRTCSLKEEYTHADVRDLYDRAAEKRTNDGFPENHH